MIRFSITLPEWYEKKLQLWAVYKGTNRATLASNIVQARIEANWTDVEAGIEAIAADRGVNRADLEAEWLGEEQD